MRKFSKILESANSEIVLNIKDIFIDFIDKGLEVNIDENSGYFTISIIGEIKSKTVISPESDLMSYIKDLVDCDKRLSSMDLEYIGSKHIILDENININLRYKLSEMEEDNGENVNGWKNFKSYCINVIGIEGIRDNNFTIDIMAEENWHGCPKGYEGFVICYGQSTSDTDQERKLLRSEFISKYPKYKDFLTKYTEYNIDWNLIHKQDEWKNRKDKETPIVYPIPFNKEGIYVVKQLVKMVSEYNYEEDDD